MTGPADDPRLARLAHRLAGPGAGADDLLQAAGLALTRHAHRIINAPDPARLAYLVGRSAVLNEYRKHRRHRYLSELPATPVGREPDPVEAVAQAELVARVRGAVASLPPADQHLLGLRYLDSQAVTRAGAAAVLGVSVTRVAQVERRALDRLAAVLGGG